MNGYCSETCLFSPQSHFSLLIGLLPLSPLSTSLCTLTFSYSLKKANTVAPASPSSRHKSEERLILSPQLNMNLFHVRNTMIMLCLCRRICAKDTERRTLLAEAAHALKVVRRHYAKRRADKNVPEMLDFCQEEGAFHFKGLC